MISHTTPRGRRDRPTYRAAESTVRLLFSLTTSCFQAEPFGQPSTQSALSADRDPFGWLCLSTEVIVSYRFGPTSLARTFPAPQMKESMFSSKKSTDEMR